MEQVPLVKEFLDVFPEELSRMPPDKVIEFGIDVFPNTQPISILPYHIASVELKELKEQLHDLLDKGFIRSSTTP